MVSNAPLNSYMHTTRFGDQTDRKLERSQEDIETAKTTKRARRQDQEFQIFGLCFLEQFQKESLQLAFTVHTRNDQFE